MFPFRARRAPEPLLDPALLDPLTGLLNRAAWEEDLSGHVLRGGPVTVGLVDLDDFAAYNARAGRTAGDTALQECARLFSAALPHARLARWGGEEFAVLVVGTGPLEALATFEGLHRVVPAPLTVSIGTATWDGSEVPLSVLARADAALAQAKRSGRARTLSAGTGAVGGSAPAARPVPPSA